MKKYIFALSTIFFATFAPARTYTTHQLGLDKTSTPYKFGANIGGTWSNLGTVTSTGIWNLVIPALPGLSYDVRGTGVPGLDGGRWFLWNSPTSFDDKPTLRVDRHVDSGSGVAGGVYKALWALCSTNSNNIGYEWCGTFTSYNNTLATTAAQNVALVGTIFKQKNPLGSVGPSWGGNFVCDDRTDENNPVSSCVGTEIDIYVNGPAAATTTDNNKQRVGLQIAAGANAANTHISRGILISSNSNAIIDNAIELQDNTNTAVFLVEGNGATTVSSNKGGWSTSNYGKGLIVGPKSVNTINPAIGIFDLNNANPWAITNNAGTLAIQAMPPLSNSTTAPKQAVSFNNTTGAVTFANVVRLTPLTIAALPPCSSTTAGSITTISNGVAWSVGAPGSAVSATGAVIRPVVCSNTAGATTYGWVYN